MRMGFNGVLRCLGVNGCQLFLCGFMGFSFCVRCIRFMVF